MSNLKSLQIKSNPLHEYTFLIGNEDILCILTNLEIHISSSTWAGQMGGLTRAMCGVDTSSHSRFNYFTLIIERVKSTLDIIERWTQKRKNSLS